MLKSQSPVSHKVVFGNQENTLNEIIKMSPNLKSHICSTTEIKTCTQGEDCANIKTQTKRMSLQPKKHQQLTENDYKQYKRHGAGSQSSERPNTFIL